VWASVIFFISTPITPQRFQIKEEGLAEGRGDGTKVRGSRGVKFWALEMQTAALVPQAWEKVILPNVTNWSPLV
jgi:hypothetical protein